VMGLLADARANDLTLIQGAEIPNKRGYFIPVTIVDRNSAREVGCRGSARGSLRSGAAEAEVKDVDDVVDRAMSSEYRACRGHLVEGRSTRR